MGFFGRLFGSSSNDGTAHRRPHESQSYDWIDDGMRAIEVGTCPYCGVRDLHLKAIFIGEPSHSFKRPIELIYASCDTTCPGGLNHHIRADDGGDDISMSPVDYLLSTNTKLGQILADKLRFEDEQ